jgi:hypothetical protein
MRAGGCRLAAHAVYAELYDRWLAIYTHELVLAGARLTRRMWWPAGVDETSPAPTAARGTDTGAPERAEASPLGVETAAARTTLSPRAFTQLVGRNEDGARS